MNIAFNVSENYLSLGIDAIVSAEITNLKHNNIYSDRIVSEIEKALEIVHEYSLEDIANNRILISYRNTVAGIGRSVRKFPPSAEALISLIKTKGIFPKVNPVVDIYNTIAVQSMFSFGVHDMDKILGTIDFRFAEDGEEFIPIGGVVRRLAKGDYVYSDQNKILAWMDSRDSELVKVTEKTTNLLLILQGTSETSTDVRIAFLQRVCKMIVECCGGDFEILVTRPGQLCEQVNFNDDIF